MKNYAGHRLAPWLSHFMVSRSETARALLTPGEIMQLPPSDEIVMVAGTPPIRATKARYCEDARFTERVLPPPDLVDVGASGEDDWSRLAVPAQDEEPGRVSETGPEDEEDGAIRNRRMPHHVADAWYRASGLARNNTGSAGTRGQGSAVKSRGAIRGIYRSSRSSLGAGAEVAAGGVGGCVDGGGR
ncbi:type IV secretory system conjugative DNA transfer VirD4/TraG family protein [Celeribacter persicus]|uniref:Type IV secretory system conjugative DNA transfer VirD4/TraG family protein n=1 Tax=Celeribacter persicus TaxID=1651082 RepID=A0A2T5HSU5_9RHOB|nr:type IV secretory system conjugative DNA transfer VirD4/TraG family protein [Celeribacter persicus]